MESCLPLRNDRSSSPGRLRHRCTFLILGPFADTLAGDLWIHFCDGYFEFYLLLSLKKKALLKITADTTLIDDVFIPFDR